MANVWRGLVICAGIPMLFETATSHSHSAEELGIAVLFLGAPLYTLSAGCISFVGLYVGLLVAGMFSAHDLTSDEITRFIWPVFLAVEVIGYLWVGAKIFITVGDAKKASTVGSMPKVVPGTDTKPIRLRDATPPRLAEEEREQRQQERINRRLNEERQRAARPKEQEVPSGAPSPSSDTLAGHFATLGIPVDATDEQIKTAYRDLAMVWHPDRFGDGDTRLKRKAEEQFKTIQAAYTCLQERKPVTPIVSDIQKVTPQNAGQWVFIEDETIQMMRETTEEAKQINERVREFLDRMKQQ